MALQIEGTTLCSWSHRAEQNILVGPQVAQQGHPLLSVCFLESICCPVSLMCFCFSPLPFFSPFPHLVSATSLHTSSNPNVMHPSTPHSFPLSHHSPQLMSVSQDLFRCHLQQICSASEEILLHCLNTDNQRVDGWMDKGQPLSIDNNVQDCTDSNPTGRVSEVFQECCDLPALH